MIPKLHYISEGYSSKELLENIQNACTSGAELVQLCLNNESKTNILKLASAAREITSHFQTRLIIKDNYKIAKEIKADGVYLENIDISYTSTRIHLYTWQIIGSKANTLQDCKTLISDEVDYICLGPFKSKRNNEELNKILGISGFTSVLDCLKTKTPIIGYGGITSNDVTNILGTGISGVAVSDEINNNFDTIKAFNKLLDASSTDEKRHTFDS